MAAWFTFGGGGEGREERALNSCLPLNLQGHPSVSSLTVSDHRFANLQWVSSTVVLWSKLDVALKMWGVGCSPCRLLKLWRGWWVWKAICSVHSSEARPLESLSSSWQRARWTCPHCFSKTLLSYRLSPFVQTKCSSLISGVFGVILKVRKMLQLAYQFGIYILHPCNFDNA